MAAEPIRPGRLGRRLVLHAQIQVPQPPDAVWPFFSDAHNLPALVPPWLRFAILTPAPIAMAVGTRIDYRLRVRGLPMRWRTRIARWEPPSCFADEQERGPYRRWFHVHSFEAVPGGTIVRDRVEFEVPGGPLAPLLARWLIAPDVLRIFRWRLDRIAERFGGDAASGSVALAPA